MVVEEPNADLTQSLAVPPGAVPVRTLARERTRGAVLVRHGAGLAVWLWGVPGRDGVYGLDEAIGQSPFPSIIAALQAEPALQSFLGELCFALGRLQLARAAFEQAEPATEVWRGLAATLFEQGELAAAEQTARQALASGEAAAQPASVGVGRLQLAEILAYRGALAEAEALAGAGLAALWSAGLHELAAEMLLRWSWALLRAGRLEAAADTLGKLHQLLAGVEDPEVLEGLARLAAVLAAARGDALAPANLGPLVAAARLAEHPLRLAELLRWQAAWELRHGEPDAAKPVLAEAMQLVQAHGLGRLAGELAVLARDKTPAGDDGWRWLAEQLAAIYAEPDLARAAERALATLLELVGAERGFLLRYDGFRMVEVLGYTRSGGEASGFNSGLADQVVWSGEPRFVADLPSAYGLPMYHAGELIGVLLADSSQAMRRPDAAAEARATALAGYTAAAIAERLRLAQQAQALAALAALGRVALAAANARDLPGLLPVVAAEAASLCGAERVIVLLGDALQPAGAWDVHQGALAAERQTYSTTIARWVYEHDQGLQILDPRQEGTFAMQASVQELGARTIDVVPIVFGGKVLGVLYTDHPYDVTRRTGALPVLARIGEAVGALLSR